MSKLKYKVGDQFICCKNIFSFKTDYLDNVKIKEVYENDLCCYKIVGEKGTSYVAEACLEEYFVYKSDECIIKLIAARVKQKLIDEEKYKLSHIISEDNEYVCIKTMTNFLGESIKKGQKCHWALKKDKSGYDLLEHKGVGLEKKGLEIYFKKVGK